MFDNLSTFGKGILTFVLVLLMVSLGLGVFWVFWGQGDKVKEGSLAHVESLNRLDYAAYDNKMVMGAEVIEAVNSFKNKPQFSIIIKTGNYPSGFYAKSNVDNQVCYQVPAAGSPLGQGGSCGTTVTIEQMQDAGNYNNYVNSTGRFQSKIYADANGNVRLIEFKQK